jgi:hypothetical protein
MALSAVVAAMLLAPSAGHAQCYQPNPYDGAEPVDFTHCIDADSNGACHGVATRVDGAYPNGVYPTCTCPDGTPQIGHGHWEYTHLHRDTAENGDGQTEEKDYATETQAMERDYENRDPEGTETRKSFDQTVRYNAKEPDRFYRAFSPYENPSGRYWQVDEWIGPGSDNYGQAPMLTWTERFFECSAPVGCATVDGVAAMGGYWSTHPEQYGYRADCGDPLVADAARDRCCGMFFPSQP